MCASPVRPTQTDLARLTKGVYMSDGFCRVQSIAVKKKHGQSTDLVMVLNEGRNRELRRILARVGHKVLRLKRIAVGPIKLADLPIGAWRRLMPNEIESLLRLAREKRRAAKSKRRPGAAQRRFAEASRVKPRRLAAKSPSRTCRSKPSCRSRCRLTTSCATTWTRGTWRNADLPGSGEAGNDQEHPDLDSGEFRPMTLDSDDDGQEFTDGPPVKRGGVIPYETGRAGAATPQWRPTARDAT